MLSGPAIPQKRTADSVFYELTRSLCPACKWVIDAQVHLKENRVLMRKRCPDHGWFEALLSADAEGYVNSLKYNKPGTILVAAGDHPGGRRGAGCQGCHIEG